MSPSSLDQRLHDHLTDEASRVPVASTDSASIRRRAERRRTRRTIGSGLAVVLLAAGVGVGALLLADDSTSVETTDTPTTTLADRDSTGTADDDTADDDTADDGTGDDTGESSAPTNEVLVGDGPMLDWQPVIAPEGVEPFSIVATSSGFYAVEFLANETPIVHRSDDGLSWSPWAVELPVSRVWRVDAAGDGILVSGGTPDGVGQETQWLTVDDGNTWTQIDLPPAPPPIEGLAASYTTVVAAARNDVIVAASTVQFDLQPEPIADAFGYDLADAASWDLDEVHLTLRFADGEVVELALAELGLSDTDLMVGPTSFDVFSSIAGGPFQLVDTSLDWTWIEGISVVGDRFLIRGFDDAQAAVAASTDGASWNQVELPRADLYFPNRPAPTSLVGISQLGDRAGYELLADGTWEATDLPDANINGLVRTGAGLTAVGAEAAPVDPELAATTITFTKDGYTLTTGMIDGDFVVTDPDGQEVYRQTVETMAATGGEPEGITYDEATDTVTIADPDTGEVFLRFTQSEFDEAVEDQVAGLEELDSRGGTGEPAWKIGFAIDDGGEPSWAWQSVEELFGVRGWVTLSVHDDTVMAVVFPMNEFEDAQVFVASSVG